MGPSELEQETQLSLTNRATRLAKHGTISYVRYGFQLVSYINLVRKTHLFWDIRLQTCRDLENRVRVCQGHSKDTIQ